MAMMMLNGVLMGAAEAAVPALDRALTHGLGLYETLKLIHGLPAFFDEHITRLEQGLEQIGVEPPFDRPGLADQIVRLSEATDVRDGACRVLVTGGPPEGRPALLVQTEVRPVPTRPLTLISCHMLRAAAALKSNSFIASHIAQRAAKAAGADDALFVDEEGRVYEATTANVFVVRDGVLTTAPTDGDILPGVTRAKLLELCATTGLPVSEAHVSVTSLSSDDGMLLTSSVRGIVAVASVDGSRLRVDEALLRRLRDLLGDAERASTEALRARLA